MVNGECLKCSDPNCENCSENVNICSKCKILYALQGNSCIRIEFII